jgi:TfoX/Sxy family transcriptional regulator of competence genes
MPSTTWKKSPADLIARFDAALPAHPGLVRKPMFGYPAAFVNGNMVCGLFQDSVVVRLGKEGAAQAIAEGGADPFMPMQGRTMSGYALVPEADCLDRTALMPWLARALDYTLTLPKKAATNKARAPSRALPAAG